MMSRMVALGCALGLCAVAGAGELELSPPKLTAQQSECTPEQQALCRGAARGVGRALEEDLSCGQCSAVPPTMPPEQVAPRATSTPLECAVMRSMPLTPELPGCRGPRIDDVVVP
jgi:hypothetical protein